MDFIANPKMTTTEGEGVEAPSLVHNISALEGRARAPWWGTKKIDKQVNYSQGPTQIKQQVG